MAFYQINATDSSAVESNTYVYKLGAGSTWRENTTDNILIGNIGADLDAAFGAQWHENPRVRVMIVGVVGATDPVTVGDPARTTYFSRAQTAYGPAATTAPVFSSSQRGSMTTYIETFALAMHGKDLSTTTANAAPVGTNALNDVTEFVPPVFSTNFGVSVSPIASFTVGNIGTGDGYAVEAALDVYRTLHSTTGADLTVAMSPGNAIVGTGKRIGTFTLDSAGNVRMDMAPTASASGYAAWADRNGLTGADRSASADVDADGLVNGVEFVLGTNPKTPTTDPTKLPQAVRVGATLQITLRRVDEAAYLLPTIEFDDDLVGPWTTAVNGMAGVSIVTTDNFYDATTDRLVVTIPASGAKLFARMKVIVP
jgi:hypothetical protein